MDAAPDKSVDAAPPGGEVAEDRPCRQCGYNLRGLRADGKCPESATPVAMSIREPLLRYSPPAYVRKLRRGNHLINAGLDIVVCILVGALAYFVLDTSIAGATVWLAPFTLLMVVGIPTAVVCVSIGAWLFATRAPAIYAASRTDLATGTVRVSLLIVLCGTLVWFVGDWTSEAVIDAAPFAFVAVATVGVHAYFRHFAAIARCVPDDGLARRAQRLASETLSAMLVLLVTGAIYVAASRWEPWLNPQVVQGLLGICAAVSVVVLVVLCLLAASAYLLHKRLRHLLDWEWRTAEEFWESRAPSKSTGE